MDDISAPEGISEVDKEASPSHADPEQPKVDVLSGHDDDEARKIEAAFNTQERTEKLKQEAHDKGKEMARRAQEVSQSPPQSVQEVPKPAQEIPKPPAQGDQQPEHLQTQPEQQTLSKAGSRLTNTALAYSQERARLRTVNREVKKAA